MRTKDPERAREIGGRLARLRTEAGMTQREAGELLGVSERSMQAYEQGETIPWRFGDRLAEIYNTTVAYIWYGKDELAVNDNLLQLLVTEVRSLRGFLETELLDIRAEVEKLSHSGS